MHLPDRSRRPAPGRLPAAVLLTLCLAGTAGAQLKDVVVTASRSQAKVEDMPLHTTIVTQDDIRRSPAQSLDQLLRNIPGLNFTGVPSTQSDPTGQSTRMRGLGNAKVLMLLDGVPIMDPFYLTTQWFKVPLSNIDHIEIVRGGNSSIWGNMAVAGVINIVSKRPRDNSGELTASIGSRGTTNLSMVKNFVISDALSLNLAIDQLDSQGYQLTPADHTWRFPGKGPIDARNTNVQLTGYYRPSADLKAYLRMGYHIQDQEISYEFGRNLQKSPDISAGLNKQLDPKSSLNATAWAQYVNFDKSNGAGCYWQTSGTTRCPAAAAVTPAQVNGQVVQYYTQHSNQGYHEAGSSLIYSRDIGPTWRDLQLGLDYRRLSAVDQENFYSAPTSLTQLQNFNSSTYGTAVQSFSGLFAQTKVAPLAPLELTLSARYDRYTNTSRYNTRTTAAGAVTGGDQPDSSKSAVNPSAALRYAVNDELALRGAVYRSFRAPGFNNTLRTFGSPNPTIANPDLGPETLLGREIGADYARGNLSVGATYYLYDIQDMIATSTYQFVGAGNANNSPNIPGLVQTICGGPTLAGCAGRATYYSNGQDGRSRGLELTTRWNARPNLRFDASYSRTDTFLTSNQVSTAATGVQLAGIPRNIVNLGVAWEPVDKLRLYLQAHYIGPMYIDTTSTAGINYSKGGSTVFDASASYRLTRDVDLMLNVVNLFNKVYSENAYAFNQPWSASLSSPFTMNVGVRMRF